MSVDTPGERGIPRVEDSTPEDELPLDVIFDILSNERRRIVLRELREGDGATTLGTLAERIAALENDNPERELTSTERKRVYICLYQSHLPRMDDANVIEFDGDRKTVEADRTLEQVAKYLPRADDDDQSERGWPSGFAGLASVASRLVPLP